MSYPHVPLSEALNLSKRKCTLSCFGFSFFAFALLLTAHSVYPYQVKITVANCPVFKQTNLHLILNSHGMQSSCISASSTKLYFYIWIGFMFQYTSEYKCQFLTITLEWKQIACQGKYRQSDSY